MRGTEGFAVVDRLLDRAKEHAQAGTREDLVEVGRALEEVLMALSQGLYKAAVHEPRQGPKPGGSAKRRLEAYIDVELAGVRNAHARALAKSLLETADSVLQQGTDDATSAVDCLEATTALVNILRARVAARAPVNSTLGQLIKRFLKLNKLTESHRASLNLISGMDIGKKQVDEITAEDIIRHCETRRRTVKASTAKQDITYLRGVVIAAREVWNPPLSISLEPLDEAKRWLEKHELIASSERRTRRPKAAEIDMLLEYFEKKEREPRALIPMRDLTLFALHSGLPRKKICGLKWAHLNEDGTLNVPGIGTPITITGPAREIIERQKLVQDKLVERGRLSKRSDQIFPYNAKSITKNYVEAKNALGINDLRFHDFRREAAIRLHYEDRLPLDEVARRIGTEDLNTLRQDILAAAHEYESKDQQPQYAKKSESPAEL